MAVQGQVTGGRIAPDEAEIDDDGNERGSAGCGCRPGGDGRLAGCEVNKTTGERTLTGAGVGAAGGAAVGLLTGNFLGSALTGAAAGAAGGFVYDQIKKNQ